MTAKSDELIDELVSAAIAFGRGQLPDWQTRIDKAQRELREYVEGLEGYRDGYDPEIDCPPEGEWVLLQYRDDFEKVKYYATKAWYWKYVGSTENITTLDFNNGDIRRWYPIGTLPEVQE